MVLGSRTDPPVTKLGFLARRLVMKVEGIPTGGGWCACGFQQSSPCDEMNARCGDPTIAWPKAGIAGVEDVWKNVMN